MVIVLGEGGEYEPQRPVPDHLGKFAAQQSGKPLDKIGELVRVKGAEIADPMFFPEPVDGERGGKT